MLLQTGLELCADGLDKSSIEYCLTDMVMMSDTTGVELLKQFLIVSGLLCILNGDHPYLIRRRLTMLLGEEIYGEVMTPEWANQDLPDRSMSEEAEGFADIDEYWENFENKELWEELESKEYWIEYYKEEKAKYKCNADFEIITKLNNREIQRILWDANNADIAVSLKYCSNGFKNDMLINVSKRVRAMIEDDMRIMGLVRARDALEAQERIVKVAQNLGYVMNETNNTEGEMRHKE